jgi:uncharacterized ferritin-like protein (DUF455 family)
MKHELYRSCWDCLVEDSIEGKLAAVQSLVSAWHQGRVDIDANAPCQSLPEAGLPGNLKLVHPSKVARRRLGTDAGRIALLHAVAHIEFSAINLALDAVYRFRDMPLRYYEDWLLIAAEECYHFTLIRTQLRKMGSDYGDLPAHNGLWDVAIYSTADVINRMALVPRVLEARGLDVTPGMIDRVNDVGDSEFADILKIILRDEIGHVRAGSHWFKYVCGHRGLDSTDTFDKILRQYKEDLNAHIRGPFHIEARLQAGFNQTEITNLTI